jgi:hypothetical protein
VENDELSVILTYKRAKNSLFECKWGGEGGGGGGGGGGVGRNFESFVGNLEGFGKSEFPPLQVVIHTKFAFSRRELTIWLLPLIFSLNMLL